MRVGLVLGAGGLTGTAFHAGVLTALAEDAGWDARDAEIIVGTSAGATAAALMRAGFPPRDYVPRVVGAPLSAEGDAILGNMPPLVQPPARSPVRLRPAAGGLAWRLARRPWRLRPGVAAAALLPAGTRPVDPGAARLRPLFQGWPTRPLWICAVSLESGRRVVFGRDAQAAVADAVAASCAVPGYYQPVTVGGERFVDGGGWSLLNLDLLAGVGLDLVVVSAPLSTSDWVATDPGNALRVPARAQQEREAAQVRRSGTPVLVFQPDARVRHVMGTRSMDVHKRSPVAVVSREHARTILRDASDLLRPAGRAMHRGDPA
ncbi:MAG: patatin-like phospholipase family protein [Actinomycetes bacterium]